MTVTMTDKQFKKLMDGIDGIRSDLMDLDHLATNESMKKQLERNKESTISQVKEEVRDLVEPLKDIIDEATGEAKPKERWYAWRAKLERLISKKNRQLAKAG